MSDLNTELGCIDWLRENGFGIDAPFEIHSVDEIVYLRNKLPQFKEDSGLDMDGIVIKPNTIDRADWSSNVRPKTQVAFKPELDIATTRVLKVVWQVSGRNRCPVAELEPVELNGTTVTHATLCNPDYIKKLGVKIGSLVEVSKRGEIIPHIEKVIA
jgi:DNA ligase (NAD+)